MNMNDMNFTEDVRSMLIDMYHQEEILSYVDDTQLIDEETVISGLTEEEVYDVIEDNLFDDEFNISKLITYGVLTSFKYDDMTYYKVTSEALEIIFKD